MRIKHTLGNSQSDGVRTYVDTDLVHQAQPDERVLIVDQGDNHIDFEVGNSCCDVISIRLLDFMSFHTIHI